MRREALGERKGTSRDNNGIKPKAAKNFKQQHLHGHVTFASAQNLALRRFHVWFNTLCPRILKKRPHIFILRWASWVMLLVLVSKMEVGVTSQPTWRWTDTCLPGFSLKYLWLYKIRIKMAMMLQTNKEEKLHAKNLGRHSIICLPVEDDWVTKFLDSITNIKCPESWSGR